MDPSLRWGESGVVALNLSDYESGAKFDGDYHRR